MVVKKSTRGRCTKSIHGSQHVGTEIIRSTDTRQIVAQPGGQSVYCTVIEESLWRRCTTSIYGTQHVGVARIMPPYLRHTVVHFSLAGVVSDEFDISQSKVQVQAFKPTVCKQEEGNLWNDASANFELNGRSDRFGDVLGTLKILSKQGRLKEAMHVLDSLNQRGFQANDYVYVCLLRLCISQKAFSEGKHIHDSILRNGFKPNIILSNALVNLYANWGCVVEARRLFDAMPDRDLFSWTIMIEAYAKREYSEEALKLFMDMEGNGVKPDEICFLSVLKACSSLGTLKQGKCVHAYTIICGLRSNVLVNSSLIDMYAKCGSLDDACQVFLYMPSRDVVVWNLIISGYAEHSHTEEAFKLLKLMEQEGVTCNGFTFFSILKTSLSLDQCKHIHVSAINSSIDLSLCFFNNLIKMYHKFGGLAEARQVFDRVSDRDVVSWNTMLSGYVQQGLFQEAHELLQGMEQEGVNPDHFTLVSALKACTGMAALEEGKDIHRYICANGIEVDKFVASTLIDMYGKCRKLQDAREVFEKLSERDVVSWNSMISVFVNHGHAEEALRLFQKMGCAGVKGDDGTFVSILKACACLGAAEQGKHVHAYIIERGIRLNIVENTLIDMYAKCRNLHDARTVFNKLHESDVVSWNAMIAGYAQHDHSVEALDLFLQMQRKGVEPDKVTFLGIIKACASLGVYERGRQIHSCISKAGYGFDVPVKNALIDMYAKCGRMDIACQVFCEVPERDVVSWNAMITGYSQHGHTQEAYDAFLELLQEGVAPNEVTFITVLKACGNLAAVSHGKQIHAHIRETVYGSDAFVRSTLVDMYAKCGSIDDASMLFEKLVEQDLVSCNAMIAGYAQHGLLEEVFKVFHRMQSKGVKLDHITYVAVLSACSHMGLVAEGCDYFMSMGRDYGIMPSTELYACLVDLYGRSGHLHEALFLVENIHTQPSVDVWMALLSACKFYNNAEFAKYVAEHVLELEQENTAAFLLLSNMYVLPTGGSTE